MMKRLLSVLISVTTITAYGQSADAIHFRHQKVKYYLTKSCYDFLEWDAIILKNKKTENKINSAIRKRVNTYQLRGENARLFCQKKMDYDFKFEVVYLKNGIVSISLSKAIYVKDAPHPWTEFQTMNFSSETGKELSFSSLFESSKMASLDSLILHKVTQERQFDAMDSLDLRQGIISKKFNIRDEGMRVIYMYQNYPADVLLTYEELQPFILRQGLLKKMGQIKK
ncbi:MAG: hypothetical protein JSS64_04705 [Bacteroidetes bacterium]|nr:hypothetical protein [Bacteroidota bacterium]